MVLPRVLAPGRLRLLAILISVAGLMTPSFPATGRGESDPRASTELAWNPAELPSELLPELAEGEPFSAAKTADEPTETSEPSEPDGNQADLNDSMIGLFVSGSRRSLARPVGFPSFRPMRDLSDGPPHARSGRDLKTLALDLSTRLCRLTC